MTIVKAVSLLILVISFEARAVMPAAKIESRMAHALGRPLSTGEVAAIEAKIEDLEAPPEARVLQVRDDEPSAQGYQTDIYLCGGGKLGMVLIAIEGLKCVDVQSGVIASVVFNHDRYPGPFAGVAVKGYAGVTAGLALDLGVMVIHRPANQPLSNGGGDRYYHSSSNQPLGQALSTVAGVNINLSVLLYGAMIGVYHKADSYIIIGAYQPGVAAELAASDITIVAD